MPCWNLLEKSVSFEKDLKVNMHQHTVRLYTVVQVAVKVKLWLATLYFNNI